MRLGRGAPFPLHLLIAIIFAGAAYAGTRAVTMPRSARLGAGVALLRAVLGATVAAATVSALEYWMGSLHDAARDVAWLSVQATLILVSGHMITAAVTSVRRVMLLGEEGAEQVLTMLAARRQRDVEVVGIWRDGLLTDGHGGGTRTMTLTRAIELMKPELVVICTPRERPRLFAELAENAQHGFRTVELSEFYEDTFGIVPVRQLGPAWFVSLLHLYNRPYNRALKRALDVAIAVTALVVTLPIIAMVALLVATTGRPIIFRQIRMGEHGRPFTILKFRTMRRDAEVGGAVWASRSDPRTTRVGRLLRRTRLDELPQLWNVLHGEMSIVGPRPERPEFLERLEAHVPYWTKRHLIKPGITGWAQISHDYAANENETEAKLAYDLWYLRHQSILVDVLICMRTIPRMLGGGGSR